jgi:hypothetical protein
LCFLLSGTVLFRLCLLCHFENVTSCYASMYVSYILQMKRKYRKMSAYWLWYLAFLLLNLGDQCYLWGPLCLWSYGSWIYNYLCNQWLSPLKLWQSGCQVILYSYIFPIFSRFCYISYICLKFPIFHPKILYFFQKCEKKRWIFNSEWKFHINITNRDYRRY